jgi:hypothetical protein
LLTDGPLMIERFGRAGWDNECLRAGVNLELQLLSFFHAFASNL